MFLINTRYFVQRAECPGCKSRNSATLFSAMYGESPIREYLKKFYSPQGFEVEESYLEDAEFTLEECSECGLVYQREIPGDLLMQKLYEEWLDPVAEFSNWHRQHMLSDYSYFAGELMSIIACFDASPSELRVFDFGMGWGLWAELAKGFGCEVYGSELSRPKIEHARSQGINVIEWDQIPDHEFDFINTEQVFEHIPEPLDTLRHLRKSLSPKGLIKIAVPDGNGIKRRLRKGNWMAAKDSKDSLHPVSPLEHINCYSHAAIIKIAEIAGLQRVKIPIKYQISYGTSWMPVRSFLKNFARPIYRNFVPRTTTLFFGLAQS